MVGRKLEEPENKNNEMNQLLLLTVVCLSLLTLKHNLSCNLTEFNSCLISINVFPCQNKGIKNIVTRNLTNEGFTKREMNSVMLHSLYLTRAVTLCVCIRKGSWMDGWGKQRTFTADCMCDLYLNLTKSFWCLNVTILPPLLHR